MIQDKIIAFLLRHPTYFIDCISQRYPFTEVQLRKYKDNVNWELISFNLKIDWTYELISEFQEQIFWKTFTSNSRVFQDISLIDSFAEKIDWNSSDYKYIYYNIAYNKGIGWNKETIEKYASKIDFKILSGSENVEWSDELLDKYLFKWHYFTLAKNESIPWTIELFEKYLSVEYLKEPIIQFNKTLVDFDFIEKYKDILDWGIICYNEKLLWKEMNLLERWSENIVWSCVAGNEFFFRDDPNFFQKNYDKWQTDKQSCIKSFCWNTAFPWTKELIEIYIDSIDWECLCENAGIAWDVDLINYFSEYIKWGDKVPRYEFDFKRDENVLVEGEYAFKSGLINNESIMWSIDLLECFETKINSELMLGNLSIWEQVFKPFVNEEMIDTIIQSINESEINDNTTVSSDSQPLPQINTDSSKSNNTYNWEDFITNWGKEFNKVKAILYYINTYSKSKQNILKIDFLNPEELENAQKNWLQLIGKFTNQIDIDFFKPYWIPISRIGFEPFIDLSTPNFTLFECNYFSSTFWHKTDIFKDINELLIELDGNNAEIENLRTRIIDKQLRFYDELIAKLEAEESEDTRNQD